MKKKLLFIFALLCTVAQGAWAATIDLSTVTEATTVQNGDVLTGKLASNVKISIAADATITLDGASINTNREWTEGDYAGLTCLGNATIILQGENTVKGFNANYPGIQPAKYDITIANTVTSVTATKGTDAYNSIGKGYESVTCGTITIGGTEYWGWYEGYGWKQSIRYKRHTARR